MESVVGTLGYMAPEICESKQYSFGVDIWSLGCLLYKMATLRSPFEGGNPLLVAQTIVKGMYEPIEVGLSRVGMSTFFEK